jgi:hypothetical protein
MIERHLENYGLHRKSTGDYSRKNDIPSNDLRCEPMHTISAEALVSDAPTIARRPIKTTQAQNQTPRDELLDHCTYPEWSMIA